MSNDLKQNFEYRIDELVSRISTLRKNDNSGSLDDYNKPKIWTKNSKNSEFAVL